MPIPLFPGPPQPVQEPPRDPVVHVSSRFGPGHSHLLLCWGPSCLLTSPVGTSFSLLGVSLGGTREAEREGPAALPVRPLPPPAPLLQPAGLPRGRSLPEPVSSSACNSTATSGIKGSRPLAASPPPGSGPSWGSVGWESGPSVAEGGGRALVLLGPLSLTPYPPSSEIEATRLAEQERKAEQRRRATVVVGDLQPLRDALPELLELQMGGQR